MTNDEVMRKLKRAEARLRELPAPSEEHDERLVGDEEWQKAARFLAERWPMRWGTPAQKAAMLTKRVKKYRRLLAKKGAKGRAS